MNPLEYVPTPAFPQTSRTVSTPIASFLTSFPEASAEIRFHTRNNTAAAYLLLTPPPGSVDDALVSGFHQLETDFDTFRTVIDYQRYLFTNHAVYIYPYAYLSLHKLKWKVELLYRTLDPLSGTDAMKLFGFFTSITDTFNQLHLSYFLASSSIGFFLTGSPQTGYTNVLVPRNPRRDKPPGNLATHLSLVTKQLHHKRLAP